MADNQGEEVKSVGKGKQKSELMKTTWKIPKDEQDMDSGGVKLHEVDQTQTMMKKCSSRNDAERVCHVCKKVFSSGKALGGHIRIHLNPSKKPTCSDLSSASAQVIKKPICKLCGKNFPSMKSLFGHMRCHPDRGWRGIRPPSMVTKTSSPSSSSLSPPSEVDDGGHMEILSSAGERDFRAVDLAASLKAGWAATAKRGRKAMALAAASSSLLSTSSEDDIQLYNAVNYLMMLARDRRNTSNHLIDIVPKAQKFGKSDDAPSSVGDTTVAAPQLYGKTLPMVKNKRKRKERCMGSLLETAGAAAPSKVLDFDLNELPPNEHEDQVGFGCSYDHDHTPLFLN